MKISRKEQFVLQAAMVATQCLIFAIHLPESKNELAASILISAVQMFLATFPTSHCDETKK